MVHRTCPGCGNELAGKDDPAGGTTQCPRCGAAVLIHADIAPVQAEQPAASGLPMRHGPERFNRHSHYLICDQAHLVAVWQNNGRGWMLKTDFGMVSAARNPDQIPSQGDFKLVELRLAMTDGGLLLREIVVYQLAKYRGLANIGRNDDHVLSAIVGRVGLSHEQKIVVRSLIHEQFMREVWEKSDRVMAYLANADHHSPGTEGKGEGGGRKGGEPEA